MGSAEDFAALRSTREIVRKRSESAEAERIANLEADAEFIFWRATAAKKGTVRDDAAKRIASRKAPVQKMGQHCHSGENQAEALQKMLLELAEQAVEWGIAEAAERVKEEKKLVDAVIAGLPFDERIKTIAALEIRIALTHRRPRVP
jgi:hypothetical protein